MTDVFPASAVSPVMQRTESGTNKSSNEKEPRKSPVAARHMPAWSLMMDSHKTRCAKENEMKGGRHA